MISSLANSPSNFLCYSMFHLQPGIPLDEIMFSIRVLQELHRSSILIAYILGNLEGVCGHPGPNLFAEMRRGGDLYQLLMASLHGAVSLVQVDHVAVLVTCKERKTNLVNKYCCLACMDKMWNLIISFLVNFAFGGKYLQF